MARDERVGQVARRWALRFLKEAGLEHSSHALAVVTKQNMGMIRAERRRAVRLVRKARSHSGYAGLTDRESELLEDALLGRAPKGGKG